MVSSKVTNFQVHTPLCFLCVNKDQPCTQIRSSSSHSQLRSTLTSPSPFVFPRAFPKTHLGISPNTKHLVMLDEGKYTIPKNRGVRAEGWGKQHKPLKHTHYYGYCYPRPLETLQFSRHYAVWSVSCSAWEQAAIQISAAMENMHIRLVGKSPRGPQRRWAHVVALWWRVSLN